MLPVEDMLSNEQMNDKCVKSSMNMTLSSIAIAEDCKSKGSQMFDEGQW